MTKFQVTDFLQNLLLEVQADSTPVQIVQDGPVDSTPPAQEASNPTAPVCPVEEASTDGGPGPSTPVEEAQEAIVSSQPAHDPTCVLTFWKHTTACPRCGETWRVRFHARDRSGPVGHSCSGCGHLYGWEAKPSKATAPVEEAQGVTWTEADQALADWALQLSEDRLPPTPWYLQPWRQVIDNGVFLAHLQLDAELGPRSPRACYGALQKDIRLLQEKLKQ